MNKNFFISDFDFTFKKIEPLNAVYYDKLKFNYVEKPPKLKDIKTGEEFIEAEKFFKKNYQWTDEEFLKLFVRVTCADKSLLPTKKNLEQQIRKLKKKANNIKRKI
jgi:hypothetical protein